MTEYVTARTFAPALAPEGWADALEHPREVDMVVGWATSEAQGFTYRGDHRHGLSALCLYGQPYGFTRADLDALRSVCRQNPDNLPGYGLPLVELASKIAALLPPEDA
jgi:hypothetical protein